MLRDTENPFNSSTSNPFEMDVRENRLLQSMRSNKSIMEEDKTPDEIALERYRGPDNSPGMRIFPTFNETWQAVAGLGSGILGMIAGGVAGMGNEFYNFIGLDYGTGEEAVNYWQEKLAYEPTEPVSQRALGTFMIPFELTRKLADYAGQNVQDSAINIGMSYEDAAQLGAYASLATEFTTLGVAGKAIKKSSKASSNFASAKADLLIGKINEMIKNRQGKPEIESAAKTLMKDLVNDIDRSKLPKTVDEALDRFFLGETSATELREAFKINKNDYDSVVNFANESIEIKNLRNEAEKLPMGDVGKATETIKKLEEVKPESLTEPLNEVPAGKINYLYKSRTGREFTSSGDGKWFDAEGREVTNKNIIKAAERNKVEAKPPANELIGVGETIEKPIEVINVENELKIKHEGEGPMGHSWTDPETGSSFMSKTIDPGEVRQRYEGWKAEQERINNSLKHNEVEKQKVKTLNTAEAAAKKHGIEFDTELMVEEEVNGKLVNTPHYQFYDPVTGEYFLSRSPNAKIVGEELQILRELRNVNEKINSKLTFEDLNREANAILNGTSKTSAEDFLKTLRSFTEKISEEEIGPGKRFETSADVLEHLDMGREFGNRFRRTAIKKGLLKDTDVQLNLFIPVDMIPDLVRDYYSLAKSTGKVIRDFYRDYDLWRDTGWWLARDNKWRYELTKSDYQIAKDFVYRDGMLTTLGKVIHSPVLFKAVPELSNVKLYFDSTMSANGKYHHANRTLTLKSMLEDTLHHEMQHAVNRLTGSKFVGTSTTYEMIKSVISNIKSHIAATDYPIEVKNRLTADTMDLISSVDNNFIISRAKTIAGNSEYNLPPEIKFTLENIETVGRKNYFLDSGEIEARLAARRSKMTGVERAAEPPWVTLENMLTEEGLISDFDLVDRGNRYDFVTSEGLSVYSEDMARMTNGLREMKDVSDKLDPRIRNEYKYMLDRLMSEITDSEARGIFEIGKDLFAVTSEDINPRGRFSLEQIRSIKLLKADAERAKVPFDVYLKDLKIDPERIIKVMEEVKKWKNDVKPLDDTQPVNVKISDVSDPIVKAKKPEIRKSEVTMMVDANEIPARMKFKTVEAPMHTFEEAGLTKIYHDWRHADHARMVENNQISDYLVELKRKYGLNRKSRERIMAYAYSQQTHGMKILNANKIKVEKLSPNEMNAYNEIRSMYEEYFNRINAVRESIGRKPLKKVDNYFTFARTINNLGREGLLNNLIMVDSDLVMNQYNHFSAVPFRFAKLRTGGIFNPEMDMFKVFKTYTDAASNHIHISPVVAKVKGLVNTRLPHPVTGDLMPAMINTKPNVGMFLNEWADFLAGRKPVSKWPGWIGEKGLNMLRKNIVFSALMWNARTMLLQTFSLRNSIVELGYKYVAEGFIDNLSPASRKFAMEKSKHLLSRTPEVEIGEWASLGKAWKAGFKPLQMMDLESAKVTWLGAYKMGKEVYGFKGDKLINFADDVTVRTQASASKGDIAPIQRTELGKLLTMFQTFVIYDWEFLTKDVLKISGLNKNSPKDVSKIANYLLTTTAINILVEDIFGMDSPFPRPLKAAYDGIEGGDDIGRIALNITKELLEPVPIIGGPFRYNRQLGGPVYEYIDDVRKKFTDSPIQSNWLELIARGMGVPGTGQVVKTKKGLERGQSFMRATIGSGKIEQGTSGRPSRSGRGGRQSR